MADKDTFSAWMRANLDADQIRDLADHGADAGWPGLTYYTETVALHDRFEDEIWDALATDADDLGLKSIPELIASFAGALNVGSMEQLKNLLTWYMAERVAHEIANAGEPIE